MRIYKSAWFITQGKVVQEFTDEVYHTNRKKALGFVQPILKKWRGVELKYGTLSAQLVKSGHFSGHWQLPGGRELSIYIFSIEVQ